VWRNIVLNRVWRGIAGDETNILPVDGDEDPAAQVSTFVHVKDRLRVAICEPVKSTTTTRSLEDSGSTSQIASSWDDHRLCIDPFIACVHTYGSSLA